MEWESTKGSEYLYYGRKCENHLFNVSTFVSSESLKVTQFGMIILAMGLVLKIT